MDWPVFDTTEPSVASGASSLYLLLLNPIFNLFRGCLVRSEQTDGARKLRIQNVSIFVSDHQVQIQVPSKIQKWSSEINSGHCKPAAMSAFSWKRQESFFAPSFPSQTVQFFSILSHRKGIRTHKGFEKMHFITSSLCIYRGKSHFFTWTQP